MSSIKIKKVKLIKQGESGLHVVLEDDGPCPGPSDKIGQNRCHTDLVNAMQGLRSHLAVLTGYLSDKNAKKVELLEPFHITGYSIGGKVGKEGIVIKGYRINDNGKTVTLNTPFTRFEEDEEEGNYTMVDDLQKKIVKIEDEVVEYLTKGKKWEDTQQELDFEGGEEQDKDSGSPVTRLIVDHPEDHDGDLPLREPGQEVEVTEVASTGGRRRKPQTADNKTGAV